MVHLRGHPAQIRPKSAGVHGGRPARPPPRPPPEGARPRGRPPRRADGHPRLLLDHRQGAQDALRQDEGCERKMGEFVLAVSTF